ncbi:unnamed protein product, partial [marine sediment metagenome]
VDFYRKELYPEVTSMWYELQRAAMAAVKHPRLVTEVKRPYTTVKFKRAKGFLWMRLASGRMLAYYQPRVQKRRAPWGDMVDTIVHMGNSVTGWRAQALIPGRIFENLVQATARDVMMPGALETIRSGYRLVGRVHDELVSERPEGTGNLEEYIKAMCPELPWLQGIPIEADGWTGFRYRKG